MYKKYRVCVCVWLPMQKLSVWLDSYDVINQLVKDNEPVIMF